MAKRIVPPTPKVHPVRKPQPTIPIPHNMREANKLGYFPYIGAWSNIKTKFISENEMVLTCLADSFLMEDGGGRLPRIKARLTAHFKFGPIERGQAPNTQKGR